MREVKGATPFTPTIVYKKFETGKSRLAYIEAGSGKPVLVLHGLGYKGTTYQDLIKHLSRNFLVIAPNLHFSIGNAAISEIDDYAGLLVNLIKDKKTGGRPCGRAFTGRWCGFKVSADK